MHDILQQIVGRIMDALVGPRPTISGLDRSIAAAGAAHLTARRALAVAVAEQAREVGRREGLAAKVDDLEGRAIQAIRAGRDDLALSAAEAIAAIRTEIDASDRASVSFKAEVTLARREVDAQRRRLADLDRGRRLARVGSALNSVAPDTGLDRLAEAEATLAQINADNADNHAVREEMTPPADRLIERLSNEGFGVPVGIRAEEVMARLRAMAAAPVLIASDTEVRSQL